jgi:hypothetical protein
MSVVKPPTNVQQYSVQAPGGGFLDAFGGLANSALSGYIDRTVTKPQAQLEQLMPILAQMKMLGIAQPGQAGSIPYGKMNFIAQNPPADIGDQYKSLQIEGLQGEMGKRPLSKWEIQAMANAAAVKDPQYVQAAAMALPDLDTTRSRLVEKYRTDLQSQQDAIFSKESAKPKTVKLSVLMSSKAYKNIPKAEVKKEAEEAGYEVIDDLEMTTSANSFQNPSFMQNLGTIGNNINPLNSLNPFLQLLNRSKK